MDCPFLSKSRLNPCKSTSDVLAHTTLFSSDTYCKGPWFPLCPCFRQQRFKIFADTAAAVAQDEQEKKLVEY